MREVLGGLKRSGAGPVDVVLRPPPASAGDVRVRLGVDDVSGVAALRDAVLLRQSFQRRLNKALGAAPGTVRVDRAAFVDAYARLMMRFTKLTPHQRQKLEASKRADASLLLAPAGGGKTFVAIQRMLEVLDAGGERVLFVARNASLAFFAAKWLVVASRTSAAAVVDRLRVLVAPFERGPRRLRVEAAGRRRCLALEAAADGDDDARYGLVVVDEAHHLVGDGELRSQLDAVTKDAPLLFLGDASQATATLDGEALVRRLVDLPPSRAVAVCALSEVVRSTKRIVAGAAAFQLAAGRKGDTQSHTASDGPPLVARVFAAPDDGVPERYAAEVVAALETLRTQLHGVNLDDRVAIVCPDDAFLGELRAPLTAALAAAGSFELVAAARASATLPRDDDDAAAVAGPQWLVFDTMANLDGLERLIVICVGLDQVISADATASETRSRLYRAMTRAQLAVAVVNAALSGGWLEFLGRVELSGGSAFDADEERAGRAETAADAVVAEAEEVVDAGEDVEDKEDVEGKADGAGSEADEEDARVESKQEVEAKSLDAPSKPLAAPSKPPAAPTQPMPPPSHRVAAAAPVLKARVKQSIWDTSATILSEQAGDLRASPRLCARARLHASAPRRLHALSRKEGSLILR